MRAGGAGPGDEAASSSAVTAAEPVLIADPVAARRWGRLSWAFAGVWLIYLVPTLQDAATRPNLAARIVGVGAVLAFAVEYVLVFHALSRMRREGRRPDARWIARALGSSVALLRHRRRHGGPVVTGDVRLHRRPGGVRPAAADRAGRRRRTHRGGGDPQPDRPGLGARRRALDLDRPGGGRRLGRDRHDRAERRAGSGAGHDRRHGRPGGAQPLRPRPSRHPRALADRHHGQGRARRPAGQHRPRPRRARRSPRSSSWPAKRWPTSGPPWPATARRRCPASWPGPGGARRRRDRGRPARRRRRRPTGRRELFAWAVREGVTNVSGTATRLTAGCGSTPTGRDRRRRGGADAAVRPPPCRPRPGSAHGLVGLRERAAAVGAGVPGPARRRRLRLRVGWSSPRRPGGPTHDPAAAGGRPGAGPGRARDAAGPRAGSARSWPRSGAATRWSPAARQSRPDVALLDVEMPGTGRDRGHRALHAAAAGVPGARS